MVELTGKFARERRTIEAMIAIYCRDHHARRKGLCAECGEVFTYAELRLDKCLFADNKPTCAEPLRQHSPVSVFSANSGSSRDDRRQQKGKSCHAQDSVPDILADDSPRQPNVYRNP